MSESGLESELILGDQKILRMKYGCTKDLFHHVFLSRFWLKLSMNWLWRVISCMLRFSLKLKKMTDMRVIETYVCICAVA